MTVSRIGESRVAALPEIPGEPAAAEDRTAFGFAIWAGVERAIGNAAVMLASGRGDDADAADRPADRAQAAAGLAAHFRRQRPPEHEQREVPVESLLLELREAARIADEIAANASADHRTDPAHPARAPDLSGGEPGGAAAAGPGADDGASGGAAAAGPGAAAPPAAASEPRAAAGLAAGGWRGRNSGPPQPQLQPQSQPYPDVAPPAAAAASGPVAGSAAAGNGGRPAAIPPDAPAAAAPEQIAHPQPAPDMPSIMIPRSERHRVRKKRSLWARLFRRRQAGS